MRRARIDASRYDGVRAAFGSGHAAAPRCTRVCAGVRGLALFDPDLGDDQNDPVCVWGCYNVFFSAKRYFALRLPNPLVARPMMAVGPIDVYRRFVKTMTEGSDEEPHFSPYTLGSDFFIFTYDWRQEIESVSAPQLSAALKEYAQIHERATGIPAQETKFVIVAHSMGGLVARTLWRSGRSGRRVCRGSISWAAPTPVR